MENANSQPTLDRTRDCEFSATTTIAQSRRTYAYARGSSGKEGGRRKRGVGQGSRDDCSLSVFLSWLFLQQRFVARKLSWFDNPRSVSRRRKPRETVGIVEWSRFQPSFSMAVAAQSFVQHTANKSNTLPATEHTDFVSPLFSRSTWSPFLFSLPDFLSLSGNCTNSLRVGYARDRAPVLFCERMLLVCNPCTRESRGSLSDLKSTPRKMYSML